MAHNTNNKYNNLKYFHSTVVKSVSITFLLFFIILATSCRKDQFEELKLITKPAQSITQTRAVVGCEVINGVGKERIFYGICLSSSPNPTIDSLKSDWGYSDHEDGFSIQIAHLKPDITYYARSYASKNGEVIYGNEISFNTLPGTIGPVTDIDGNIYNTVIIGEQVWMVENLKTTRFRNGDTIPYVSDIQRWDTLTSGAYCFYNNDTDNASEYGNLYNWYAATDKRSIAPDGWHAATDEDWFTLVNYLTNLIGYEYIAEMLREDGEAHWINNSSFIELNETGFTALPGGKLEESGFEGLTKTGCWWGATEYYPSTTYYWEIYNGSLTIDRKSAKKTTGFAIRCVKDKQ